MPAELFASLMVQPATVRCIGVELCPFSLGHHFILHHEQSPFVVGGRFPLYDDLILAAFVCSNTWQENLDMRRAPFRRWLRAWAWGRLAGKFDVAAELVKMATYVRDAEQTPEAKRQKGCSVRYIFSDWYTRLHAHLISLGFTEYQALDMPLAKANRLFIAHLEENGLGDFTPERDDSITRALSKALDEAPPDFPERSLSA
jgi:hypothetical protein